MQILFWILGFVFCSHSQLPPNVGPLPSLSGIVKMQRSHYETIGCSPLDSNETISLLGAKKMLEVGIPNRKREISDALKVLTDNDLRALYDAQLNLERSTSPFSFSLEGKTEVEKKLILFYALHMESLRSASIMALMSNERKIQRNLLIEGNEELARRIVSNTTISFQPQRSPRLFLTRLIAARSVDLFLNENPNKKNIQYYLGFLHGKIDFDAKVRFLHHLDYYFSDSQVIAAAWLKGVFTLQQRFSLTADETLKYFETWASSPEITHSPEWMEFWLKLLSKVNISREYVMNHFIKMPYMNMGSEKIILETFIESLPSEEALQLLNKIQVFTVADSKSKNQKITLETFDSLKPFWQKLFQRDSKLKKDFEKRNNWGRWLLSKVSTTALCTYSIAKAAQSTKETKSR